MHVDIKCPRGLRLNAKNAHFGVLSSEVLDKTLCDRKSVLEDMEEFNFADCSKLMGATYNKTLGIIKENCHFKKKCTVPLQ